MKNNDPLKPYENPNWQVALKLKKVLLLLSPYKQLADELLNSISDHTIFLTGNKNPLEEHPNLIDDLVNPKNALLKTLWSPEWAATIAKAIEYRLACIYQSGMFRRAFRTQRQREYYSEAVLQLLQGFFLVNAYSLSPDQTLDLYRVHGSDASIFSYHENIMGLLIAVELDKGNPVAKEIVHKAIYENSGTVSYAVIYALFYSRQESVWKMAVDLLLAAKLQEGLRQAVIETCSDGRFEAFQYILRAIAEHSLLRFSSVVRAFDTWTNLALESARPDTVKRAFSLAFDLLEHPEKQRDAVSGDNPLEVYLGLWAEANTEAMDAIETALNMLEENTAPVYKQCAALAFVFSAGRTLTYPFILKYLRLHSGDSAFCAYLLMALQYSDDTKGDIPKNVSAQREIYYGFKELALSFPAKKQKIKNPVFEWQELELCGGRLWHAAVNVALGAWNVEFFEDAAKSMPEMPANARTHFVENVLEYLAPIQPETRRGYGIHWYGNSQAEDAERRKKMFRTSVLRQALFAALSDKSMIIRESALNTVSRMKLSDDEIVQVENMLALKTSSIRRIALEILQKNGNPQASAVRLRASGNAEKIAAADELAPKASEALVIDKAHGYGLYDVHEIWNPVLPKPDMAYHPKNILRDNPAAAKQLLSDLSNLLNEHRQDECKRMESPCSVSVITTLDNAISIYQDVHWASRMTENMLMPELWDGYFAAHSLSIRDLVHAFLLLLSPEYPDVREEYFGLSTKPEKYDNAGFLRAVIHRQLKTMSDFPKFASDFCIASFAGMPESFWKKQIPRYNSQNGFIAENDEIQSVFSLFESALLTPDTLAIRYSFCRLHPGDEVQSLRNLMLPLSLMLEAFDKKFITQNTLRRLLLTSEETRFGLRLSSIDWNDEHPEIRALIEDAVKLELRRGEMPTELSRGLGEIRHLRGAFFFAGLLNALGSQALIRGYAWGIKPDKATTFSHLLKICRPLPEDNAESFKKQLAPFHFSEKRLLEAAMYSPAWLDLIGTYLNIPALSMAGWYFHAHLHEQYSFFAQEKESYVIRYSPVSLQEFSDGAFDIDWFHEAYKAVGPEMFAKLYDAAKYISGGANHRRSQIFADAALGKLKEADIELNMASRRNKEYVMTYGILPGKDFLRRYEKLAQFRKESRQFGGQRQASEKLAVEIALGNLARTAGFSDVNRFLWRMESAQLDALKALFVPLPVGEVAISLAIDDSGRAAMKIEKNGKAVKSLPAALKKNETVLELQEAVRKLRDQHSRAKKSLEEAMTREDVFEYAEVKALMENPVLGPLASKLLWQSGETIDLFENLPEKTLKIAHPLGLLNSGRWAELQRFAVERRLVQPFKQIFRELYTLNEDEKLDGRKSDRYSGNQVMPKQAVALLRTRGWTVDMEEGLQKVFHKRDLIAKIYAMADWFSPADVEPPTLEYVQFEHRRTGEIIPLETIPPVLFSEVMRDLDLMVSVAHAGGVDPEASHSTVEMRAALVSALLPLFKLKNVRIEKSHAFITGKFGEYNVHLGSGVCHKQTWGMLNILPVHSQTRGRLFLPFADDDPKTSEVVTKILFLAEDDKIKDPSILEQIKGGSR